MRTLIALALACSFAACASSAGSPGQPRRPAKDPDLLKADEIATARVQTAYDAVSRLRPRFLVYQGGTTQGHPIQVIVDGAPRSGLSVLSVLSGIRASDVVEIRYLRASDATTRYGTGYSGGAIEVRTLSAGSQ